MRRKVALAAALCSLSVALPSSADGAVDGQPTEAPRPDRALVVEVHVTADELDATATRAAISNELGLPVVASSSGEARGTLHVRSRTPGLLEVTYEPVGQRPITRSIAIPDDPARRVEVVALLAGNLVRSEADEILAEMMQARDRARADAARDEASGVAASPAEPPAAEEKPAPEAQQGADRTSSPTKTPPRRTSPEGASARTQLLPLRPVNLSFFHPISLPESEKHRYVLELGLLYGRIGGLSGLAVSGAATWIDGPWDGVMMDGLGAVATGDGSGVQAAGLGAWGRNIEGGQASGLFNVATQNMTGVQFAGATNVVAKEASGVQVAGVANIAARASGLQLAGVANVARGDATGLQLSIVNVSSGRVRGAQVGIVNVAKEIDGFSLGLASFAENIRVQGVAFYSSTLEGNVAAKFTNDHVYTQTSFGYGPDGKDHVVASGLSIGWHQPLVEPVFIDADVGFWNETTLGENVSENEHVVRYRALAGVAVGSMLDIVAGGGIRQRLPTGGAQSDVTPELVAGVQLF